MSYIKLWTLRGQLLLTALALLLWSAVAIFNGSHARLAGSAFLLSEDEIAWLIEVETLERSFIEPGKETQILVRSKSQDAWRFGERTLSTSALQGWLTKIGSALVVVTKQQQPQKLATRLTLKGAGRILQLRFAPGDHADSYWVQHADSKRWSLVFLGETSSPVLAINRLVERRPITVDAHEIVSITLSIGPSELLFTGWPPQLEQEQGRVLADLRKVRGIIDSLNALRIEEFAPSTLAGTSADDKVAARVVVDTGGTRSELQLLDIEHCEKGLSLVSTRLGVGCVRRSQVAFLHSDEPAGAATTPTTPTTPKRTQSLMDHWTETRLASQAPRFIDIVSAQRPALRVDFAHAKLVVDEKSNEASPAEAQALAKLSKLLQKSVPLALRATSLSKPDYQLELTTEHGSEKFDVFAGPQVARRHSDSVLLTISQSLVRILNLGEAYFAPRLWWREQPEALRALTIARLSKSGSLRELGKFERGELLGTWTGREGTTLSDEPIQQIAESLANVEVGEPVEKRTIASPHGELHIDLEFAGPDGNISVQSLAIAIGEQGVCTAARNPLGTHAHLVSAALCRQLRLLRADLSAQSK